MLKLVSPPPQWWIFLSVENAPERSPRVLRTWHHIDVKCRIILAEGGEETQLSQHTKKEGKHQKHKAASTSPESPVSSHSALRADWVHSEDQWRWNLHEIHRGVCTLTAIRGSESESAILPLRPSSSSVGVWGEASLTQSIEDDKTELQLTLLSCAEGMSNPGLSENLSVLSGKGKKMQYKDEVRIQPVPLILRVREHVFWSSLHLFRPLIVFI